MTREESINKTKEIAERLRHLADDLDMCKEDFIDFYDEAIDGEKDFLLGIMRHKNYLELLFCPDFPAYTKSVRVDEYDKQAKSIKRTELIDDILKK